MPSGTVFVSKFVGTISLGLLTGVSATLSTITLPSLLSLPTATTARTTLSFLTKRTRLLTSYVRHVATFALFSAYVLSPRRFRHPYLLYTSIITFGSGAPVEYLMRRLGKGDGVSEERRVLDLEAQGDDVNGEEVGEAVERMRVVEGVRGMVSGFAFAVGVVGIWGDGA